MQSMDVGVGQVGGDSVTHVVSVKRATRGVFGGSSLARAADRELEFGSKRLQIYQQSGISRLAGLCT